MRSTVADGLWLGVQLVFVISGYCIAAAVDNSLEQELRRLDTGAAGAGAVERAQALARGFNAGPTLDADSLDFRNLSTYLECPDAGEEVQ